MKIDRKGRIERIRKKITIDHIKHTFTGEEQKKHLKQGSYSSVMTIVVLAVIVAANLVISQIPSSVTQIDVSEEKLYTLSEEGKLLAKNLKKEVTLYYYVNHGSEDDNILKLLENFENASGQIKVEKIDPDLHPNFTAQYTSDTIHSGSIIVACGEKSKFWIKVICMKQKSVIRQCHSKLQDLMEKDRLQALCLM